MSDLIDRATVQSELRAYLVHESSEIALNVEQIIAAIPARGGEVKALEWADFDGLGAKASAFYQANYLIQWWKGEGRYEVALSYPGYQTGYDGERWHDTLEAAKAAAQADYEARILAALAPTEAAHVNETPKSEHDAGNVLTDAAQAREAALREALAQERERCAKIADAFAEENIRMAGDTVLHDPVLHTPKGKKLTAADWRKSEEMVAALIPKGGKA